MADKKYTMRAQISGTRNGVDWPKLGGVISLPEAEGDQMVKAGLAYPGEVKVDRWGTLVTAKPETATPRAAETRKATGKRGVKAQTPPATKAGE